MFATERTAAPMVRMVVCSKQWRIKSEKMEKQRRVTHVEMLAGALLLLSRIKSVTRARCVLERSRRSLLACCADSISGAQMTKFSTLVRTLTFWPVRRLSADIFHKKASSCSMFSMRTLFPAQGKCTPGLSAVSLAIRVIPRHEPHCSFILCDKSYGRRHLRLSRHMNSSEACGPQEPDS